MFNDIHIRRGDSVNHLQAVKWTHFLRVVLANILLQRSMWLTVKSIYSGTKQRSLQVNLSLRNERHLAHETPSWISKLGLLDPLINLYHVPVHCCFSSLFIPFQFLSPCNTYPILTLPTYFLNGPISKKWDMEFKVWEHKYNLSKSELLNILQSN